MPRQTTRTVAVDALPEFLRSKAIGAVIAEALDHQVHERGTGAIASLGAMVEDAAREIRDFHGLPGTRPTPLTPQGSDPMGYGEDAEATA